MAFYQPVKPGEPVKHSARRENDISALLNHFNGISAVSTRAGMGSAFKIAVCNRTQAVIPAGYAVEINPDAVPSAEAVPVKLATTSSDFYQVTTENMQPGDISSAICMGVATVQLSAALPEGTRYVEPGADGLFQAATGGRAQVISTKEKKAIILLGGGGNDRENDDVIICKITGGNAKNGFSVSLFPNGKDQPSTGNGLLFAAELAINAELPTGSWVLGHKHMISITGGNET